MSFCGNSGCERLTTGFFFSQELEDEGNRQQEEDEEKVEVISPAANLATSQKDGGPKQQGSLDETHFLGGIKLDAKMYGSFAGFPLVHEVWLGVIFNDPLKQQDEAFNQLTKLVDDISW